MFSLFEILEDKLQTKIIIVDVGAALLGDEPDPYDSLRKEGRFHVIGFEPVEEQCEFLKLIFPEDHSFFPYFIGDGSKRTFHLCQNPLTSSLYEPNLELLSKLNLVLNVTDKFEVQTRCLDDIVEISDIDFLKLDVQGAELDVIKGASRLLKKTLVVHTEVEFVPLYRNQPLFGEIDIALRSHNFLIHTFLKLMGGTIKPLTIDNEVNIVSTNQILYAEAAIYVKSFMEFESLAADKLLRLATILHEVYGSYNLCAFALDTYDRKKGTSLYQVYSQRLRAEFLDK
ncbi:MAG: FkbM family methyltransferase [Cyanobacteriota bacterium]|nr:FkbM family methyltransferase [Cyanobacteriota bacterium]